MEVEFTKQLSIESWKNINSAVDEREDNLKSNGLSDSKKRLLEKIQARVNLLPSFEEYRLLMEMAAQTKKLWKPNQTLLIYFMGGTSSIRTRALNYASIWSHHCSITFQETLDIRKAKIRVGFEPPGSWSYVGTDALNAPAGEPTVNFGWLTDSLPEREFKRVVLHEFGHVLGLIHEHQSPAIKINWNKTFVYNYFFYNYRWSKEDVDRNIFHEFETSSSQYSTLDKASIMGYCIPQEFTTDGQSFPQNDELSAMDMQYIGKLYPHLLKS